MESTGTKLKKTRLEKNLTIEDVYKKTKIHTNILLAIEEDRLSQLSPVYVKGFLKLYAEFLGLDPKEIIQEYHEPRPEVKVVDDKGPQEAGLKIRRPDFKIPKLKKYLKYIAIPVFIFAVLFGVFKAGKFLFKKIATAKAAARVVSESRPAPKQKPVKKVSKQTPKQLTPENRSVSLATTLVIRAREDSWVQVKLDGRTIFQGILKKGFAENWTAKEKIELSLGNAGVVELQVNGNTIPPLGKRNQAVKNIVITKEGLSTSR